MNTKLQLTVSFAPESKAGQKFTEFYKDLQDNLVISLNGKSMITNAYQAITDEYGNVKILAPDRSVLDAIDGRHPDFAELDDKEGYIIRTLLDSATKHKMLNTEEGLKAMAKDIKKGNSDALQARVA